MIGANQSKEIAERERVLAGNESDPLFHSWGEAVTGEPVLVHTVLAKPSYWIVPVVTSGRVIGAVRVLADGQVATRGVFYAKAGQFDRCPPVVTGLTDTEAFKRATVAVDHNEELSLSRPIFVHDGPIGREAWLVVGSLGQYPVSWIFVGLGGTYERPAGVQLEDDLEA